MPSLSPSNPCGSGGSTSKLRAEMSSQVKSGGGGGMYMSGYEESQAVSFVSSSCAVGDGSFSFVSFGSYSCLILITSACSAAIMACSTSLLSLSTQPMLLPLHFVTEQ